MALFIPPKESNGIPLSERSRWLLYAPAGLLIDPMGFLGHAEPLDRLFLRDNQWLNDAGVASRSTNPWVAAYTFTVARGNIDQLGKAA